MPNDSLVSIVSITLAIAAVSAMAELRLTEANVVADASFPSSDAADIFKLDVVAGLKDQTFLFIAVTAAGSVQVTKSTNDRSDESLLCSGQGNVTCAFLLADVRAAMDSVEGFRFSARSISAPTAPIKVGVYVGDHLDLHGDLRQSVILKNVADLPMAITVTPEESTAKLRIQLKAHPEHRFAAITAYLNVKQSAFPSPESHEQEFDHLDAIRSAFTAYEGDAGFCAPANGSCVYRLLVQTAGIAAVQVGVMHAAKLETVDTGYRYVGPIHAVRPGRSWRVAHLPSPRA